MGLRIPVKQTMGTVPFYGNMKRLPLLVFLCLSLWNVILVLRLKKEKERYKREHLKRLAAIRDINDLLAENGRLLRLLFQIRTKDFDSEEKGSCDVEDLLNRYEKEAVTKVRRLLPRCREHQIRRLCYFFAGLSYQSISSLTHDSIPALKESKSRYRKIFLSMGTETGNFLASLLDGPGHVPETKQKGGAA